MRKHTERDRIWCDCPVGNHPKTTLERPLSGPADTVTV